MDTINNTYVAMLVTLTVGSIIVGSGTVGVAAAGVRRAATWFQTVFTVLVAGFVLTTAVAAGVITRALAEIPRRCSNVPFCLVGETSDFVAAAAPFLAAAVVFIITVVYITIAGRTTPVARSAWVDQHAARKQVS